ncbi:hypothetical protein LEN26_016778 [Aphanomyces euteiches]|nr:hypothetical protein LEN26_016778 [Aphanomyces euteiches]KAH9105795.1 hypothetical protein AeMF1_018483 [Aphanomyces euteiches]KAH9186814.1 hypothetical protein AeNC1_011213 [Aphanomyces euteiches]
MGNANGGEAKPAEDVAAFKKIPDKYETYEQLEKALRDAGLESSNLIVGIDYTKSNTWTGARTYQGKSLHDIDPSDQMWNPYQVAKAIYSKLILLQRVIYSLGRTLEAFDDDRLIPVFGFGDVTTGGSACFPFLPDGLVCHGFAQVLERYNQITPLMQLAGPTNFAPVIREAIQICKTQMSYHILVIIADGLVTNREETVQAIVDASEYPLSIVMVGVGDGPWDVMKAFDDFLPARRFDNFQFVDFDKMLRVNQVNPDVGFATAALMEIPAQFKKICEAGIL